MEFRTTDLSQKHFTIIVQLETETNYWINVLTRVCSVGK